MMMRTRMKKLRARMKEGLEKRCKSGKSGRKEGTQAINRTKSSGGRSDDEEGTRQSFCLLTKWERATTFPSSLLWLLFSSLVINTNDNNNKNC